MKLRIVLFGLFWHTAAFAEVSDKMRSIPEILIQGGMIAVIAFFLSRLRWWLPLLLLPMPILLFVGTYSLWLEQPMRQALIREQGMIYFAAMLLADMLVLLSVIFGGALAWRQRKVT